MQVTAATRGATRPTHIRGADLLTMDPTLKEMQDTDVLIENGRISAIGNGLSAEGAEVIDPDFRFGYGTFTHPSSRHALIVAGSA